MLAEFDPTEILTIFCPQCHDIHQQWTRRGTEIVCARCLLRLVEGQDGAVTLSKEKPHA